VAHLVTHGKTKTKKKDHAREEETLENLGQTWTPPGTGGPFNFFAPTTKSNKGKALSVYESLGRRFTGLKVVPDLF